MQVEHIAFRSKRRFGVEIEVNRHLTQAQLSGIVNEALSQNVCQCDHWGYTCNNDHWIVKPDSSCGDTGERSDGGGYEVVSAVGHGAKHLSRIALVTKHLNKNAARVNKFCGLHCQVEIRDFSDKQAATLLAYWCRIEPLVSEMVPDHRVQSYHCKLFTQDRKKWSAAKQKDTADDFWRVMKLKRLGAPAKRNTITLLNYQRTKCHSMDWQWFSRPTVELRFPESSLDDYNVKNWARFFVHFVETCSSLPYPTTRMPASFEDFLQIIGLKSGVGLCTVLSPGLFETKCWMLYRLSQYARRKQTLLDAKNHWEKISSPYMKWSFNFPQVTPLKKPI